MESLNLSLIEAQLILGLILLSIEILVLGMTTFVLFFAGLALLISAGLMYINVVPETLPSALITVAICSSILAAALWKPMKRLQNNTETSKAKNDFIGHRFILKEAISKQHPGTYRFSGIDWTVISEEPIDRNIEVEVIQTDVGILTVKAIN